MPSQSRALFPAQPQLTMTRSARATGLTRFAIPGGVKLALRVALAVLPLLTLLTPDTADAYPWMAKHAYTACSACHTDPSGGELLTPYGRILSEETLSTKWGGSAESARRGSQRSFALRRPESFLAERWAAGAKLADKAAGEKITLEEDAAEDEKPKPKAEATEAEGEKAEPEAKDAEADTDTDTEGEEAAPSAPAETPRSISGFMFGLVELPEWLLLGGSYRHMNIIKPSGEKVFRTFPMMMDLYGQLQFGMVRFGGSIGGARVPVGSPFARASQVTANQGDQWNLISRTHFVGVDPLPELAIRAGRLNLPFGVRIPEHTMWVRQVTRTDRESSQQHGVAAAYTGETLRGELMGIAGNYQVNPDEYRERGYSGYLEYSPTSKSALGVSSLVTIAKNDRLLNDGESMTRQVHGAMMRLGFTPELALLAEMDGLFRSRHEAGYVGFAQLDYEPLRGFHLMLTGEMLDEGHSSAANAPARVAGAGKPKLGGWLSASWFFLTHFDMRIDALKRQSEDFSVLAQLHVYL